MLLFAEHTLESLGFSLMGATAFGVLGILLVVLGFKAFEWLTPKLKVEEELGKGNIAVAVVVASLILGVTVIVFRAMS